MARRPGESFYLIISGQVRGPGAACARFLLWLMSLLYRVIVAGRYALYQLKILRVRRLARPVISVGNVTVGGTGKTPMIEHLCHYFSGMGCKPAVLTRGYKAIPALDKDGRVFDMNDEGLLLRKNCPGAVVVTNPSRYRGGLAAIGDHQADVMIVDDGFQHRQLARDLDIVLVDALIPFGFEHIVPRGLLREPLHSLRRANLVVLTRADAVTPEQKAAIVARLRGYAPGAPILEAVHEPYEMENMMTGEKLPPESLAGKRVWLVSSIANPVAFRVSVEKYGPKILYHAALPDHYIFTDEDARGLADAPIQVKCDYVVLTEKDAVKLEKLHEIHCPCPVLIFKIRLSVTTGQRELLSALEPFTRPESSRA